MQHTLINKGYSGWQQLGIFVAMVGVGLVVGSLGAGALWAGITGQGILNMEQDMLNPKYANAVRVIQLVTTLFVFFFPAVAYALICWRPPALALGFRPQFSWRLLGICLLILLVSLPIIDLLTTANKAIWLPAQWRIAADKLEAAYELQVQAIGNFDSFGQYLLTLFMIAGLPALFEEVLFRGALQGLFARWWKMPLLAIVFTALLFSLVHASWYGFLPRVALGVVLGLIFHYTKNIWYTVIFHFVNNGAIVTYLYVSKQMGKALDTSTVIFPIWGGLIAIGVLVALLRLLKKQTASLLQDNIYFHNKNPFGPTEFERTA